MGRWRACITRTTARAALVSFCMPEAREAENWGPYAAMEGGVERQVHQGVLPRAQEVGLGTPGLRRLLRVGGGAGAVIAPPLIHDRPQVCAP